MTRGHRVALCCVVLPTRHAIAGNLARFEAFPSCEAYYNLKLELAFGRIGRQYTVLAHGFLVHRSEVRVRVSWKAGWYTSESREGTFGATSGWIVVGWGRLSEDEQMHGQRGHFGVNPA